MAWPTDQGATGELISAAQWNRLPMLLADTTVTGAAAATIDVTSIPAHWTHLMLVGKLRMSDAAGAVSVGLRFNNDSSAIYEHVFDYVVNATENAGNALLGSSAAVGLAPAATSTANRFGSIAITIPYYTDATNHKTFVSEFSAPGGSAANMFVGNYGGAWANAAAVNRVTLIDLSGGNFEIGCRVSLYGLGRI